MRYHKIVIFFAMLLLMVFIIPFAYAAMYDDVNAYWKMDGNWDDSSGKGNNGTGYGGVGFNAGKYGQAAVFDGQNDYVRVNYSSDFIFSNNDPFTVSVWVDLINTDGSQSFLSTEGYDGAAYTNWNLRPSTGTNRVSMVVRNSDNTAGAAGQDIACNEWHHIVGVVDELKNITFYVDGVSQGSSSYSVMNTQNGDLVMGRFYTYVDNYYLEGMIDEVAIWGRALGASEVDSVYNIGIEKFEALLNGINSDGELDLGYTTEELATLAQLYADGKAGLDPDAMVVGDNSWTYLSGDLPGDIGGITYNIGDSWIYEGKYYIKLGSGLEGGAVPEMPPFAAQGMVLAFGAAGVWVRKRREVFHPSLRGAKRRGNLNIT